MPLYEYQCEACAHRFEKIVQYSDPPIETCPVCGGKVQKQFSSPAIQFKGSGFYITDYAKKSSSESSSTGKSSSDKAEKAGEKSSSESAPEKSSDSTKPEAKSTPAPAASTSSKE
jgi:putative FmdB family regulatory protein